MIGITAVGLVPLLFPYMEMLLEKLMWQGKEPYICLNVVINYANNQSILNIGYIKYCDKCLSSYFSYGSVSVSSKISFEEQHLVKLQEIVSCSNADD